MRHHGDFRYLRLDVYPHTFELYLPNSRSAAHTIDDLRIGDSIRIFYHETSETKEIGLHKFVHFIEKDRELYFIRNAFYLQLGYVLVILAMLSMVGAFFLWKRGALEW